MPLRIRDLPQERQGLSRYRSPQRVLKTTGIVFEGSVRSSSHSHLSFIRPSPLSVLHAGLDSIATRLRTGRGTTSWSFGVGLRKSRGGRAPRSARPAVRTSPTQARRLGPVLRSVPARRGVIRQPFRGNRNSPVISRLSLPFEVDTSTLLVVLRNMVPDPNRPPSPEWAGALRDTAPNANSPIFRMGIPITPPGLRMPVNAPEPEARPFSVARPALESLTNYLRPENADAGPAWVNPPTPRPHNLATSTSASSAESLTPSSLGSNSGIIMYHRLNDDQIHLLLEDPDSVNPYDVFSFRVTISGTSLRLPRHNL
ncbi:hypothetical protein H4Q26_015629 [Puccinia striiformis f. sp. tritici PST-130]|nr:hypothetical protein H4Q26_015629 [Puccinia striiformis f. sp. tritici PST-130]